MFETFNHLPPHYCDFQNKNNNLQNDSYTNCVVCKCTYNIEEMNEYKDGYVCYECLYLLKQKKQLRGKKCLD